MNFAFSNSAPDDARIAIAMGNYLNLGAPATQADIVAFLIKTLNGTVIQQEQLTAGEIAEAAVPPLGPFT